MAYRLWEEAGRPEGGADEFWYAAERLLAEERQGLREEPAEFEGIAGGDIADEAAAMADEAAPKGLASARRRPPAR